MLPQYKIIGCWLIVPAALAAVVPQKGAGGLQQPGHYSLNGLQKYTVNSSSLLSPYKKLFKAYKIMFHPSNDYPSEFGNFIKYDNHKRTITILKDGYARFNIVVGLNTRRLRNRSINFMLKLVVGGKDKSVNAMYVAPNLIIPLRIDTTIAVKSGEEVEVVTNNKAIEQRPFYTSMEVTWL